MPNRRCVILLLVVAACGACGFWFLSRHPRRNASVPSTSDDRPIVEDAAEPHWRSPAGYVGSQACRDCHPHEYETFLETSHSRAMSEVSPERESGDVVFDQPGSGRRYRVTRQDGQVVHAESLVLDDGSEMSLASFPVKYAIGSGHFGKTYLCEVEGLLVESPISWYETRHSWGMSPGYERHVDRSFSRVVDENCLLCHAGKVETSSANDLRMRVIEESIGCERCHGPGQAHVEGRTRGLEESAQNDSIVNPRRLSRKLSEAVCQQCHLHGDLQVLGRGVRSGDYRPGLALEPYRCEFRMRKPGSGMTVVGHFEQMENSACYRQSEALTCITCHNLHAPVEPANRPEHYRTVCLSCHADRDCKAPLATRQEQSRNECVRCHMPSSATEVPHVAFTHHRIGIHPLRGAPGGAGGQDPFVVLSDMSVLSNSDQLRALLLARMYVLLRRGQSFAQSPRGQEVARQIDEASRALPVEAVDGAVEVARAEVHLTCGRIKDASEAAERALQRSDIQTAEEIRALVVLGTIAMEQNRFSEARGWFARLTRLRRDASDLYDLGICENNCGQIEAAIATLESCRNVDPASIGTYETLEHIYRARREIDEANRQRSIIDRLKRHSQVVH